MAVPNTLKDVAFMVKDSKRFADIGANSGTACHTIVKSKEYVFTRYEKK